MGIGEFFENLVNWREREVCDVEVRCAILEGSWWRGGRFVVGIKYLWFICLRLV